MSIPKQQNVWLLNEPPAAEIQADTFKLVTQDLPELKDGDVLVKLEYISNDPAQRGWIQKEQDPERAYLPPVKAGEPMRASGQGTVIASKSSKWAEGKKVYGNFGWADYVVVNEKAITMEAM